LQGNDLRPLHGRWLSPRYFRTLGDCLNPPECYRQVRSERKAGRIAFAHYLAESMGLVALAGPHLTPVPAVLPWLDQPASTQLRDLWRAWLSPTDENRDLWQRYHLPGYRLRDPVGFAQRLIHLLAESPAATELDWDQMDKLVPWWEHDDQTARALVQEMLAGPLCWLGIVQRQIQSSRYALTPIGAWFLEQPGASLPNDDVRPLTLASDLSLHLPDQPQLAGFFALAHWADFEPDPAVGRPCLYLNSRSIARAWECGGRQPDLLAILGRYVMPALTPAQRDTLHAWFDQIAAVTIRPGLIIQTSKGDEMDRLWQQPAIRPHLGRRLAPELATLETSVPEVLIQTLRCPQKASSPPGE